jgi:hypothetical protein
MRHGRFITAGAAAIAALAIGPAAALASAGSVTDDSAGDFAGGTVPGSAWIVEPGTVALQPTTVADNFDGAVLGPAVGLAWTTTSWDPANPGSATLGGGSLSVNGAHLNDGQGHGDYTSGKVMEFRATFGAVPYQNVGLGDTFSDSPWAMFSTGGPNPADDLPVGLYARTRSTSSGPINVRLDNGTFNINPAVPHRYRIEWTSSDVRFYVDGALVATNVIAIDAMRPVVSDVTTDATAVKLDWLGMSAFPFTGSGAYVSRVFDVGTDPKAKWTALTATAIGAAPAIQTRTGNTPTPDASWSQPEAVVNGAIQSPRARYIQYTAALTPTAPSLDSVRIDYDVDASTSDTGGGGQSGGTGAGGGGQSGGAQGGANNGATTDKTKPEVTLAAKSLRASKKGAVSFNVGCPATETSCIVTLKLKNGAKTVASKTFTVKGGKTKTVTLVLNEATRKLLGKRGSLKVSTVVSASDAAGNHRTTTKAMTFRGAVG